MSTVLLAFILSAGQVESRPECLKWTWQGPPYHRKVKCLKWKPTFDKGNKK